MSTKYPEVLHIYRMTMSILPALTTPYPHHLIRGAAAHVSSERHTVTAFGPRQSGVAAEPTAREKP